MDNAYEYSLFSLVILTNYVLLLYFRVCDNNNMALPLSDLPGMCPHHIF